MLIWSPPSHGFRGVVAFSSHSHSNAIVVGQGHFGHHVSCSKHTPRNDLDGSLPYHPNHESGPHRSTYQSMAVTVTLPYYRVQIVWHAFPYPALDCTPYPKRTGQWKIHVSYDPTHHSTIFDTHWRRSRPTCSPIYHSPPPHRDVSNVYIWVVFDVPSADVIFVHCDRDYQKCASLPYLKWYQSK